MRNPLARVAVLPVLLVVLGGCAVVPVGGPVLPARAVEPQDPLENPYIRVIPAPPQPDWSPEQIVRGFLAASASFENHHAVARRYLAPSAQWGPNRQVTVYRGGDLTLEYSYTSRATAEVTLEAPKLATIDQQGQYVGAAQDERMDITFQVRKVDGRWRITELPDGLQLTPRDVSRAYRVLNLYYFEPELLTLVPDPVFVPVQARANLPTALVRALLRGPTDWLAPAVRPSFPRGTKLLREVQVTSGTVTVDLRVPPRSISGDVLTRMSAQLVWTLKQLPDMQQLRLRINGETKDVPNTTGEDKLQSRNDWQRYSPDGPSGGLPAYFVRDGAVWLLADGGPRRVAGVAGTGQIPLDDPAVSLDGRRVAALGPTGVYIGELHEGGEMSLELEGKEFTALSWDRYGNLWAAEAVDDGSRIWIVRPDGRQVQVKAPELENDAVRALRVARDGTRVAAVVGHKETSELLLGRVVREGGEVRAEKFLPLATDLEQLTDVAWRDADRLVVLGRGNRGAILPYLVDVDGTDVSPTGSVGGMESIAAAPRVDLLTGTSADEVWRSSDELSWRVVGPGTDPVYPG